MPPSSGKSAGKRAPKNGGIGSAVLHHCLRQQAENTQRHQAFIQSLRQAKVDKPADDARPGGVALGGNISRHRTLDFLSGGLTSASPSRGSVQSRHAEQHLRSIIERNGLDEYLSTALAAQESFSVDKYEARLLHEPTAPSLISSRHVEKYGRSTEIETEGGDVRIPRRPVAYSKGVAEACKEVDKKERACESLATRNRRRRNRARVKLLLAGKVEEATIHNIQFVRQQRDELHRRYQKAKDVKSNRRQGRAMKGLTKQGLPDASEEWCTNSESSWDSDVSQGPPGAPEGTVCKGGSMGESDSDSDLPSKHLASDPSSAVSEDKKGIEPAEVQTASLSRLPRTAAELDEVELESFLQWRRTLAKMEDEGVLLTPYEKNLEVWRQLWRVVERSHLVLQIVDGRSPAFFRCKDLEKYIKEVSPDKHVILVVNKSDLLPLDVREKWSQYFALNGVNAIFFSALRELNQQQGEVHQQHPLESPSGSDDLKQETDARDPNEASPNEADRGSERLVTTVVDAEGRSNQEILSCDSLVNLLVQYRDAFLAAQASRRLAGGSEFPEDFVVGAVGYPNVGKSSLINALLRKKKVSVSQQPGKTRRLQTIPLKGKGITLCDCPGLVFPKAVASKHVLVLNGVVPVDEMRGDYLPSIQMVCDAIPYTLVRHYGITAAAYLAAQKSCRSVGGPADSARSQQKAVVEGLEAAPVLLALAAQRHFVSGGKGGQLDLYRVAKIILRDFTTGRLLRCHVPGGGVFGADAEAAETAKFLSAVLRPIETRLEKAEPSFTSAGSPASRGTCSTMSGHTLGLVNPMALLQELEEDSDLLGVENGEVNKAGGRQASYAVTKRKARQVQKQLQKGKEGGVAGVVYRR